MGYTMIIAEKPQASERIAEALAEDEPKRIRKRGAYYFEFIRNGKKHVCVPAVGHLFGLSTKDDKSGWSYPVFSYDWVPTYTKKESKWTIKYFKNIEELARGADEFIDAADMDTEGEVLLFNILRFICGVNDAKRMMFSTLTRDELIESYENMSSHILFPMLEAGLTRVELDWLYGINVTRALTLAMKAFIKRAFVVVSSGRVQSPTLKILVDREKEIRKFIPVPFWQLELHCLHDDTILVAHYEKDKIWNKEDGQNIFDECKDKDATVKDIKKRTYKQLPPVPFNTTTLQTEAYRCFGLSPKQTMSIAEALYNQALISYPRTASQKLPKKIGYERILSGLSQIEKFNAIAQEILSKKILKPREGKKTDPAHLAIYPTGEVPKGLTNQQYRLYTLIVKRFFSVFGNPAIREAMKVSLEVDKHKFILPGIKTVDPGWIRFYSEFVKFKEQLLPTLNKGQVLKVKELLLLEKETQPPDRYTQGSIIKEMEERGLGTRATRAQILQTLYDRGYVRGKSIEVTGFGEKVVEVLNQFCPKIVSEELTKKFEEEMEKVSKKKRKRKDVVNEAKNLLLEILSEFKKNQDKIGEVLSKAYISFRRGEKFMGNCPECGNELRIITSRKTGKRFMGCSGYENGCRFSTPLPQTGQIKSLDKQCDECGFPLIAVRFKGKRWYTSCTNMQCPTKKQNLNK